MTGIAISDSVAREDFFFCGQGGIRYVSHGRVRVVARTLTEKGGSKGGRWAQSGTRIHRCRVPARALAGSPVM